MKRLPLIFTLLAVIALTASCAFWFIELNKKQDHTLAAMPDTVMAEPSSQSGAMLFGGQAATVAVSNYQLTGVVSAGPEGVAILVADGQPAKAVAVGREIAPGVVLKEVLPQYVMLSEGGILKRIELAKDDKTAANSLGGMSSAMSGASDMTGAPGDSGAQQQILMQQQMQMQQMQQQQQQQQQQQPQQLPMAVPPQELPGSSVPVPAGQPMEVPQQPANIPAPPPPVQMPAPTRNMGGIKNTQQPTQ